MTKETALTRITNCGVVAVIRAQSPQELADIAQAAVAGGIVGIEVTMTTPGAIAGIEKLASVFGDRPVIGVGTVLDASTAATAIHAGAEFVVSPVFDPAVVEATKKLGKISIPGAYSPREILTAWNAGADVVKVFPATALGPGYFKDLLAPMPFLKLTPTGGVDLATIAAWIKARAVMVGVGSSLASKDDISRKDWTKITQTAEKLVQAVQAARA